MKSTSRMVLAALTLTMGCGAKSSLLSDDGAVGPGSGSGGGGGGPACSPGDPPVVLTTALGVSAMVVDERYAYFVVPSSSDQGAIMKVAKAGGEVTTLAAGVVHPGPLAVDATHLYVTSGFDILRMAKDGAALTTFASGYPCPNGIVLDDTSVYWATCDGTIMSAPKVGGSSVTLAATVDEGAHWLAASDSAILWSTNNGRVRSVAKSGGPSTLLVDDDSHATRIAVHGDRFFWADDAFGHMAVKGAALDGSDVTTVAALVDEVPLGLAAGGDELVVGFDFPLPEAATGSIVKISTSSGEVTVLADGQRYPWWLALDTDCVYWTSATGEAASILRAPR